MSVQPSPPNQAWEAAPCALCGIEGPFELLLTLPHPDAPGGQAGLVRCTRCGLRRLQPRPGPAIVGLYYGQHYNAFIGRTRGRRTQLVWDFLRDVSAGAPGRARAWRIVRPPLRRLAEWAFDINITLDGPALPRVLEVGCGFGDLLLWLQSRGCAVQGVDLDERAAAAGCQLGVPVLVGQLRELRLPGASFDAAVLCHSLEHIPDPAGELEELARLVRPGGRLHVALPNGEAAGLRLDGAGWAHLSFPLHLWYFDGRSLVTLLERHGFVPVRPAYSTSRHHYLLRWRNELRTLGLFGATRHYARHLRYSLFTQSAGDVLRVVAERRPDPAGGGARAEPSPL